MRKPALVGLGLVDLHCEEVIPVFSRPRKFHCRYGKAGEKHGTVGVLEVRPHETINIYDGQPICLMEFFHNSKLPDHPYGFSGNNYSNQRGPQLAKFFDMKH